MLHNGVIYSIDLFTIIHVAAKLLKVVVMLVSFCREAAASRPTLMEDPGSKVIKIDASKVHVIIRFYVIHLSFTLSH
jgi:hypothetical protein